LPTPKAFPAKGGGDEAGQRVAEREPSTSRLLFVSPAGELNLLNPQDLNPEIVAAGIASRVEYSSDGTRLACCSNDGSIRWYDLAERKGEVVSQPGGSRYTHFAISHDGRKVAYKERTTTAEGHIEYVVRVWRRGRERPTITGMGALNSLAWSPDGSRLAIGAGPRHGQDVLDRGVWIWDGGGPPRRVVPPFEPPGAGQHELMWSPDGEWIATATTRPSIGEWTGDLFRSDGSALKRSVLPGGAVKWLPGQLGLVVGHPGGEGTSASGIYQLEDGTVTPIGDQSQDTYVCVSPDGDRALVIPRSTSGQPSMVDVGTLEQTPWGQDIEVHEAVWSPNGTVAAEVWSGDIRLLHHELWLIDVATAEVLRTGIEVGTESGASLRWVDLPAAGP
jgi:WD40 repeat protein